ncbi:hypothetical protein [Phnomibacter ginsenosidimutans]|uniref:Uncharacterized protein n=1 Tax=Phnomibacter ginsenosidimutans TaxID=2676868 RepID=A0A6I6GF44_9BACT|nr:hypothetical protein [Phnomibacter ginsenosidimutans]QGW29040.1 hypothetical protein GLV81_13850 [Phnomibacter ginsenosidimutans]
MRISKSQGIRYLSPFSGVISRNYESAQIEVGDVSNSGIFEMTAQQEI